MVCDCKKLEVKHASDLPIAWITVTIHQDSLKIPVACSTQSISIFNTFFKEISKLIYKKNIISN